MIKPIVWLAAWWMRISGISENQDDELFTDTGSLLTACLFWRDDDYYLPFKVRDCWRYLVFWTVFELAISFQMVVVWKRGCIYDNPDLTFPWLKTSSAIIRNYTEAFSIVAESHAERYGIYT